ncbi:MAG: ShlB/FhaC/HecB family hemolysin secretion/activation protein, partial [Lentisphaeria bacterium]|nr:ShlB/FhaC/HecB family hemolysin secretion/activation protein [Lentisphaeria bacterium]
MTNSSTRTWRLVSALAVKSPKFVLIAVFSLVALASLPDMYAQGMDTKAVKAEQKAARKALDAAQDLLGDATKQLNKLDKALLKLDADLAKAKAELATETKEKAKDSINKDIAKLEAKRAAVIENRVAAQKNVGDAQRNLADATKRVETAQALADKAAAEKALADKVAAEKAAAAPEAAVVKAAPDPAPAPAPATEPQPVSEMVAPWTPAPIEQKPILKGDQPLTVPEPKPAEIAKPGAKLQFDIPMVSGDKAIVEKLQVWKDWAEYVTFNPVTADDLNDFHAKLLKALHEEGYVFATVEFPTKVWAYGIFLAKVDCGPLGNITVRNAKHYSPQQIIRALQNQDGKFNYAKIHGDLFDMNTKPDLKLNTKLKPVIQGGRRVIDAEIDVDDKLPIHGAIELVNNGSKETSDWRMRTTLQHLNLTKHNDVLTFDWLTGGLFKHVGEDLNAISGSYYLPIDDLYSFNVYGGWNSSDIDDVLPEIGVQGRGYYAGVQLTRILQETATYKTQVTLGWFYQNWRSKQDIYEETYVDRELIISMPSLTLGYSDKVFDAFKGRNFASITLQKHTAGTFGSSERSEFNEEGAAFSDGDFLLTRIQLARFQRLFDGVDSPGKWSLFTKVDVQLATDD